MGVRDLCAEKVRELWPLAYGECVENDLIYVDLERHSASTAALLMYLFSDRLRFLGEAYKYYEHQVGPLRDIAYTAGLLHDFGKSSTYYLERWFNERSKRKDKITFPYHEHVISLVILQVAYSSGAESTEEINAYKVVSRVIARHHSAINERHPYQLLSQMIAGSRPFPYRHRSGAEEEIKKALEKLCNPKVLEFAENLAEKHCNGKFCKSLVMKIVDVLKEDCESRRVVTYVVHIKDEATFKLHDLGEEFLYDSYKITSSLAGFLIVTDNIVSSYCEKRLSDDETAPAYVETWKRELYPKIARLLRRELPSSLSELLGECSWA